MKGRSRICVPNTVTPSFQPIFLAHMNSKYLSYGPSMGMPAEDEIHKSLKRIDTC